MVEFNKKFYLYDRWFEYQKEEEGKIKYTSIPQNSNSSIKIIIDKQTFELILYLMKDKQIQAKIEISDITQLPIEIHYIQEQCDIMEIENNKYDNLTIELFSHLNNNNNSYQIKFIKKHIKSHFPWVSPSLPLNTIMNLDDIDYETEKVSNFLRFSTMFLEYKKNLYHTASNLEIEEKDKTKEKNILHAQKLVIPQDLYVYDRIYHLSKVTKNTIVLKNDEEEIRNLEIKWNIDMLTLSSITFRILSPSSMKNVVQIFKNDQNQMIVRYTSRNKQKLKVGYQYVDVNSITSTAIFDENNSKIERNVIITLEKQKLKLIEHPYLHNNYTDGNGNLYNLGNANYGVFSGLLGFAPNIYNSIEKKMFKEKVLTNRENINSEK